MTLSGVPLSLLVANQTLSKGILNPLGPKHDHIHAYFPFENRLGEIGDLPEIELHFYNKITFLY